MRVGRHLRRKHHVWFFRFRWPRRLAPCRLAGELLVSLRTQHYSLALQRARILRARVEELMSQFQPGMSKAQIEALVRSWIDACLWQQELQIAETRRSSGWKPPRETSTSAICRAISSGSRQTKRSRRSKIRSPACGPNARKAVRRATSAATCGRSACRRIVFV
jgi:hypothetical protein